MTVYFLSDGPRLLEEYDATGTPLATHLHGPRLDEVLWTRQGTSRSFRLEDGLGSVTEVLNSAGDLVERYTYEAFGLPTILAPDDTVRLTSAIGNRFLFTGREWDATPELYHYRARYYEPWIGRFYQRDPFPGVVGLPQTFQQYMYTLNNPTTWIDPWGLLQRGTKKWGQAKAKAAARLRSGFMKAQQRSLQCPLIPGKSLDESIEASAEAIADELSEEEWGFNGFGLLSKKNQESLSNKLRQEYPDWPWAQWDKLKKQVEEESP